MRITYSPGVEKTAGLRITTTHQPVVVRGPGSKIAIRVLRRHSPMLRRRPHQKRTLERIGLIKSPVRIGAGEITGVQIVDRVGRNSGSG